MLGPDLAGNLSGFDGGQMEGIVAVARLPLVASFAKEQIGSFGHLSPIPLWAGVGAISQDPAVGLPAGGHGRYRVIGSPKGNLDPTQHHSITVIDGMKGEGLGHPTILVIVN